MKRILYHGSTSIIKAPVYGVGNKNNDYGLGFYCCSKIELGKEWAARGGNGFLNQYSIRDDRLKILDLTKEPFNNVLYWVALLMANRTISPDMKDKYPRELKYLFDNYLVDVSKYDVVIGYRADDSYFRFPEAFVRSEITFKSLQEIFEEGQLGKQYVLISKKAFENLKFIDYQIVEERYGIDYYHRKNEADKTFEDLLRKDRYSNEKRMRDLVKDES